MTASSSSNWLDRPRWPSVYSDSQSWSLLHLEASYSYTPLKPTQKRGSAHSNSSYCNCAHCHPAKVQALATSTERTYPSARIRGDCDVGEKKGVPTWSYSPYCDWSHFEAGSWPGTTMHQAWTEINPISQSFDNQERIAEVRTFGVTGMYPECCVCMSIGERMSV